MYIYIYNDGAVYPEIPIKEISKFYSETKKEMVEYLNNIGYIEDSNNYFIKENKEDFSFIKIVKLSNIKKEG